MKFHPIVKNKSHDKIVKNELKPSTIEYVRNITQYDLDMYNQARIDFPLSMWSNFNKEHARPKPLPDHIPHLHMKQFDAPDLLGQEERTKARLERKQKQKEEEEERARKQAEQKRLKALGITPPKEEKKAKVEEETKPTVRQFPSDHKKTWNTAHQTVVEYRNS